MIMPIQMADELPSVASCRELLGDEAAGMTDAEVLQLRDDLAKIADVIIPAIGRGRAVSA